MSAKAKPASGGPNRWWQWVLIYPTLAISMASAVPDWVKTVKAINLGIPKADVSESEMQQSLWRTNFDCSRSPYQFYENPAKVKVDATICQTGDVLVRYFTPDSQQGEYFVSIGDLVSRRKETRSAFNLEFIASAHAARFTPKASQTQQSANVICQRFEDDRYVSRHVSIGGACYDERIDTLTGAIVDRRKTQCRDSC